MFFLPTASLEEHRVLSVHKNHFLMAAVEFQEYRWAFLKHLARLSPATKTGVDPAKVRNTYLWDTPEVGPSSSCSILGCRPPPGPGRPRAGPAHAARGAAERPLRPLADFVRDIVQRCGARSQEDPNTAFPTALCLSAPTLPREMRVEAVVPRRKAFDCDWQSCARTADRATSRQALLAAPPQVVLFRRRH